MTRRARPRHQPSEPSRYSTVLLLRSARITPNAALDRPCQINPAPAHDAMLRRVWTVANTLGHFGFLLRREQALWTSLAVPIGQPGQALIVGAMDPVAQRLTTHTGRLCDLGTRCTLQHKCQCRHPSDGSTSASAARRSTLPSRVQIVSDDVDRQRHAGLRQPGQTATNTRMRSYGVAHRKVLPEDRHRTSRYLSNRGNSHRLTRRRERQMQRFTSPDQAQRFLSSQAMIYGHFRPHRHPMTAARYHCARARTFRT